VGFGGRAMDGSAPKYLNTSQTPVFDKGRLLYAMDLAKSSVSSSGEVVIVMANFRHRIRLNGSNPTT